MHDIYNQFIHICNPKIVNFSNTFYIQLVLILNIDPHAIPIKQHG